MNFQVSQGVRQVEQLSGHSVPNDTVSSLVQIAASTDTGLVITNIAGIQKLLSGGNSAKVHMDESEEIQAPSSNKSLHSMHEKIDVQLKSQGMTHVPGCCGESHSGCHHSTVSMFKFCKSGLILFVLIFSAFF
jgi:hypothetical protein